MEISNWMTETTASKIMTRDLVTVNPQDTLAIAADVMLREQVSGAPVVDDSNICVGVLSISDFLGVEDKAAEEREKIANSSFWNSNLTLPMRVYSERLQQVRDKLAPAAEQPVERFMTSDLVSATEEAPLATVVQSMVDAHIHRVVILDLKKRLRGIISTTDVLAALLHASRLS